MRQMLVACGLILFVALPATAQEQRRQRFGAGPGGGGQMALLAQKPVQEDLKLTEEQVKKVQEATAKQRESFRGLRDLSREERREKMQELTKENEKAVKDILAPEQAKRLKQISLQQRGLQAINDPEVAKELNLTDDQKEKLKSIQQENRSALRELTQGGNREELRTKFQELRKSNNEKIQNLLTSEQKAKLKGLTGEPFKGQLNLPGQRPRRDA